MDATDNDGRNAIIYGVKAGKAEIVKYLKELGADVTLADNEGRTATDYVNITGLAQMVDLIGTEEMNKRDAYGNTPLHQACNNGHSEVVRRMLQMKQIEVDSVNDIWETPLYIAVKENNFYITELLLKAGAEVGKTDDNGEGLLHIAARQRKTHIVEALVKHGGDCNSRNKYGETPLICAIKSREAEKGSIAIVEILLEAGADVNVTDMWGKSALYYAVTGKNEGIVELLLEAGVEE